MSDGVRETFCTKCLHREVCAYKDTYLRYNVMDDWQKTMDALVKAFDEFAVKVKEMADALAEAFGFGPSVSENKRKKKSLSSPARYGMSLRKSRRDSFVKQYSYRPIARKHLPYQRRNY